MIATFLGLVLLALGFIAAGGIDKVQNYRAAKQHKARMDRFMALPHGNLQKQSWDSRAKENVYTGTKLYDETILLAGELYLKAVTRGLPEQEFETQAELFLYVRSQLQREHINDYRMASDD